MFDPCAPEKTDLTAPVFDPCDPDEMAAMDPVLMTCIAEKYRVAASIVAALNEERKTNLQTIICSRYGEAESWPNDRDLENPDYHLVIMRLWLDCAGVLGTKDSDRENLRFLSNFVSALSNQRIHLLLPNLIKQADALRQDLDKVERRIKDITGHVSPIEGLLKTKRSGPESGHIGIQ